MLDSPFRLFRCFICVGNHLKAPLQDFSLLVEHLAKHFEFHLFECRNCKRKFVTPFLANFHIKEGSCKREEGELCDDGGPLLNAVDLETVEFSTFCDLQNAITKCIELMMHELQYGEDDLLNCLCFIRKGPDYPASPEPKVREERQMQTSPPMDDAVSSFIAAPLSAITAAPRKAYTKEEQLVEGCCFVSDSEEQLQESVLQKAPNVSEVVDVSVEDSFETVSNSPVSAVSDSPLHSPFNTRIVDSPHFMSSNHLSPGPPSLSYSSQDLMVPNRQFDPPINQVGPASSTSSAVNQSLYCQLHPGERSALNKNMNSLHDPLYPDLVSTSQIRNGTFDGTSAMTTHGPTVVTPSSSKKSNLLEKQERGSMHHLSSFIHSRKMPVDREECGHRYIPPNRDSKLNGSVGAALREYGNRCERDHSHAEDMAVHRAQFSGHMQKQCDSYDVELGRSFCLRSSPKSRAWKRGRNEQHGRQRLWLRTRNVKPGRPKRSRSRSSSSRSLRTRYSDSGGKVTSTRYKSSERNHPETVIEALIPLRH